MRIISQTLPAVTGKRLEQIVSALPADAGLTAGQVSANGLTVPAQMTAIAEIVQPWRRNACLSMSSSRVSMSSRNPFELVRGQRPPASKGFRQSRRSHTGGDFQWAGLGRFR